MDMGTIVLSLGAALIGTLAGSGTVAYLQGTRNRAARKTAIKALALLKKYADETKSKEYTKAQEQFNKDFNMAQKRSMLVALHKLGVPIEIPVSGLSSIDNISFLDKVISKKEFDDMIEQIKNGSCDNLFFSDVDVYFSEGLRRKEMRDIAKKFVEDVMKKSSLNTGMTKLIYPDSQDKFSVGELNTIATFRAETLNRKFYNDNGKANIESMDGLIKEIERGLWDTYIGWDFDSYMNSRLRQPQKTLQEEVEATMKGLIPSFQEIMFGTNTPQQNKEKRTSSEK